ncbi:MAG: hypothetical protein JXQ23_05340 [Clostridia bacterium]|nr:hypothetical protein [Clostridia bacterium]
MKQIYAVIILAMMAIYLLTGCGNKIIEIKGITGEIIEVDTKDLSKEQIEALEKTAAGDYNIMSLMQSGVFTQEELMELNLFNNDVNRGFGDMGEIPGFDFSAVDINDLNLDNLTQDQIDAVKNLISGETTLQEVLENGVLTNADLTAIGLMPDNPGAGAGTGFKKPDSDN